MTQNNNSDREVYKAEDKTCQNLEKLEENGFSSVQSDSNTAEFTFFFKF